MDDPFEHKIVEVMGSSWDAAGHRPPRNWHVVCSCAWRADRLPGQVEASDAWREHVRTPVDR